MSLRRVISVLGVCVVASGTIVAAAPKKDAPKKDAPKKDAPKKGGPMAPAKDAAAPAKGSAAGGAGGGGSGSGSGSGEAVQMTEDAPPKDMNGVDENPDAPHGVGTEVHVEAAVPAAVRPAGYPIEEALRPITLPQNMSEVSIDPHFQSSPYAGAQTLRARFGVTRQVQVGLTYMTGGIYDDPLTVGKDYGFHPGKAVGPDVTVLLQNWIGVRVGLPMYVQPFAMSVLLGAPMKFQLADNFAIGGLDDLLNINVHRFAPSFYQEQVNAVAAANEMNGTEQSRGHVRFSAYGIYQYQPNVAIIGRFGIDNDLGASGGTSMAGNAITGTTATFIRAGADYAIKKYLDLGASIGFDDLAHLGSFGLAGFLAFRI